MKKLKDQIEIDIKRFIDNIETQSHEDKIQTLRDLFSKHLHLNTCDYMMDIHDLQSIISRAKGKFASESVPIHLGKKKRIVSQSELPNLFVIEATISHMVKNECLNKIPKFDKRENKL